MPPIIKLHEGVMVVRDDFTIGGTKSRVLGMFMEPGVTYAYASPAYGYAQVAIAATANGRAAKARIFTAARKELHPRTLEARSHGAEIVLVPHGYLSNVQAQARRWVDYGTGFMGMGDDRRLLPFGLDFPAFIAALADVARTIQVIPTQVWCVAGSGTLTRALQQAWPKAEHHAVRIGARNTDIGTAIEHIAPESFEQDAKQPPPFPSCSNYDAKAWQFVQAHRAKRGRVLFWNVAR